MRLRNKCCTLHSAAGTHRSSSIEVLQTHVRPHLAPRYTNRSPLLQAEQMVLTRARLNSACESTPPIQSSHVDGHAFSSIFWEPISTHHCWDYMNTEVCTRRNRQCAVRLHVFILPCEKPQYTKSGLNVLVSLLHCKIYTVTSRVLSICRHHILPIVG
jgi:hypothetical protein